MGVGTTIPAGWAALATLSHCAGPCFAVKSAFVINKHCFSCSFTGNPWPLERFKVQLRLLCSSYCFLYLVRQEQGWCGAGAGISFRIQCLLASRAQLGAGTRSSSNVNLAVDLRRHPTAFHLSCSVTLDKKGNLVLGRPF